MTKPPSPSPEQRAKEMSDSWYGRLTHGLNFTEPFIVDIAQAIRDAERRGEARMRERAAKKAAEYATGAANAIRALGIGDEEGGWKLFTDYFSPQ